MNPPFHPPSVCPSANLSSFHLPHTETHQWGPHPSSVFQEISALPGALISHWGTRFCICTFFPKIIHYLLYKRLYFQSLFLLSSPLATCFPFGHTQPMSPLVGALLLIYPCRHRPYLQSTTQVTYLYPLNLFTLSRLWHNLSWSCRPPDTRPCHTVAATVYIIHPPTKGSLESSHFLTSSMYLCHFLTSVDSMKPFASGSRVPLLSTSAQFSRRATVS
jgi:hypothetical protein